MEKFGERKVPSLIRPGKDARGGRQLPLVQHPRPAPHGSGTHLGGDTFLGGVLRVKLSLLSLEELLIVEPLVVATEASVESAGSWMEA